MGLFKKTSKSASEFKAKLKSDPEYMLKVLHLFDDEPDVEDVRRSVKKLGFDLEVREMLIAIRDAGEYYKAQGSGSGGSSGGSSNGGGFMGFTQ